MREIHVTQFVDINPKCQVTVDRRTITVSGEFQIDVSSLSVNRISLEFFGRPAASSRIAAQRTIQYEQECLSLKSARFGTRPSSVVCVR